MPHDLTNHFKAVEHVLWILVWHDLVQCGGVHSEMEGCGGFVDDLACLVGHHRVLDGFIGQNKAHVVVIGNRGMCWELSSSRGCLCDIGCGALEAVGWLTLVWSGQCVQGQVVQAACVRKPVQLATAHVESLAPPQIVHCWISRQCLTED